MSGFDSLSDLSVCKKKKHKQINKQQDYKSGDSVILWVASYKPSTRHSLIFNMINPSNFLLYIYIYIYIYINRF